MMTTEILKTVQFVMGPDGQPTAVQMDMETWNTLLDWLEDNEDRAIVRAAIPDLRKGPKAARALRWEDVEAQWDDKPEAASRS